MIQKAVATQSCKTYGDQYVAVKQGNTTTNTGTSGTQVNKYKCCPKVNGVTSTTNCITMD
jgi:hypothetical protein